MSLFKKLIKRLRDKKEDDALQRSLQDLNDTLENLEKERKEIICKIRDCGRNPIVDRQYMLNKRILNNIKGQIDSVEATLSSREAL